MQVVYTILIGLGIIYAAALFLALCDRMDTPEPYVSKPPKRLKVWMLPLVLPAWILALTIWLIVYAPVFAWRFIRKLSPSAHR